jgi:hypothetical protein
MTLTYQHPDSAYEREMVPDPDCQLCHGLGSTRQPDPDPYYPPEMFHEIQVQCPCLRPGPFAWERVCKLELNEVAA